MKKLMFMAVMAAAVGAPLDGKADADRINLWPLVGYEDGALDVIWPLGHFKDTDEWRFFPIIRDRNLFAVFPELWFWNDAFAILPFYAEYDFHRGTLFPVLWWNLRKNDTMHSLFPLYYYHGHKNAKTFWAGCGLIGYDRYCEQTKHWFLPLYAKGVQDFYSIPYSRAYYGKSYTEAFLCGLAGREVDDKGQTKSHWCFPLYSKDRNEFKSLPLYLEWNKVGDLETWCSLPLLSGGKMDKGTWKEGYLCGLAGRTANAETGSRESWCAPLYYANSKGTLVTPVYGQSEQAKWGLPGWYKDAHSFVSPLWYQHTDDKGRIDQWMMPLLLSGGVYRGGSRSYGFLLNAAGFRADDNGYFASWCMPLYFKDNTTLVTPLYGYHDDAQWCFPLWYKDERSLYSLFWCQAKDASGDLERWAMPLLLSGGKTTAAGAHEAKFLFGLGGATWGGKDGRRSSWVSPFYYEDNEGTFVTLLGGWRKDASWILPLFYTDKENFVSLPYAHNRDAAKKSDAYIIPPLLTGVTKYDDGRRDISALILYGHGTDAQGKTRYDYLFPLYHYNGDNGDFTSLIYGRKREGSHTNTWWATPLVGTRSGSKTGGWLFPLFNREKDASFDRDLARLDAPTIPEDITFTTKIHCWTNSNNKSVNAWTNVVPSVRVDSKIRGSVLLGSDFDHSVYAYLAGPKEDRYRLEENSKRGNRLVFNRETSRTVTYEIASRQKVKETRSSETTALCGLFHDERRADIEDNTSYARTRVLWKFWDREARNGNVTVDAFPGFTYDSQTNGYTKTSFLWRFFRYEKNPATGTEIDFLFIPVWR